MELEGHGGGAFPWWKSSWDFSTWKVGGLKVSWARWLRPRSIVAWTMLVSARGGGERRENPVVFVV